MFYLTVFFRTVYASAPKEIKTEIYHINPAIGKLILNPTRL